MKAKMISILMILIAIMAFSGVSSAAYISDSGSSTSYGGYGVGYTDMFTWQVVNYSKNHIVFKMVDKVKYYGTYIGKVLVNLKMWKNSKKGKVYGQENIYVNGNLVSSSKTLSTKKKTSRTAYQQFKANKKNTIAGCKIDCVNNLE